MMRLLQIVACLASITVATGFMGALMRLPRIGYLSSNVDEKLGARRNDDDFKQPALTAVEESSSVLFGDTETTAFTNVTIQFPSFSELMSLLPGECIESEPFKCGGYNFRLKVYPRGAQDSKNGKSKTQPTNSGFGMSYRIFPMFSVPFERVAMYLQYLPDEDNPISVDASFSMRLKGNQAVGRKFDVEWRAGMRFVKLEDSNLAQGRANDFGAHLMQTFLLQKFMGVSDDYLDDPIPLCAQVQITIHASSAQSSDGNSIDLVSKAKDAVSFFKSLREDIRTPMDGKTVKEVHEPERVRVGKIVVPILHRLRQRPRMFEVGAYPGVEYRILRILDPQTGQDRFTSVPNATYEMRPIYPLVQQLERPWPIRVKENEIPKLFTQNMYNAISAIGSLVTAIFGLFVAFSISQCVSLYFIPTLSMDPTLQVGDVLLVDKVTPRLIPSSRGRLGDVVLFSPPQALRDIVAQSGGRLTNRDLFVKRVAAGPGDTVTVMGNGGVQINGGNNGRRNLCEAEPLRLIEKYVRPHNYEKLKKDEIFVLGDCSSVSVDSRVWGPLQSNDIVGKPIVRLWPLERFGPIKALPTVETDWND